MKGRKTEGRKEEEQKRKRGDEGKVKVMCSKNISQAMSRIDFIF
jgi:hypothetical protein